MICSRTFSVSKFISSIYGSMPVTPGRFQPILTKNRSFTWQKKEISSKSRSLFFLNNNTTKHRSYSSRKNDLSFKTRSTVYYIAGVGILCVGMSYAAVPLYRIFCQAYSYGGTTGVGDSSVVENMKKLENRFIKIRFNADTASSMRWNFKPQQSEITVIPGETALAFYTARNPTDSPVTGISTYNVLPFEAGKYFNKIQCFCFEEQLLNPREEVDMPVFFYIDPEFAEDPKLEYVDTITLSYTFFEAKEGLKLPMPSYVKPHSAPAVM